MKGQLILYVDDMKQNLMLFEAIFEGCYNIITTESPGEALSILKIKPVKLVISDFVMPEMNGIELLQIVKNKYPEIIRVMLTSNDSQELREEAIKTCELFEFLEKPINRERIDKVLQDALYTIKMN